jgi:hypothetical protein
MLSINFELTEEQATINQTKVTCRSQIAKNQWRAIRLSHYGQVISLAQQKISSKNHRCENRCDLVIALH